MATLLKIPIKLLALMVKSAFQPLVTGPLLAILLCGPAELRRHLVGLHNIDRYTRALRVLTTLGVIRSTNSALNSWATNNWQIRAQHGWDWPSELAVVTGGCSGIGKALAYALSAKGIRVAVLDVQDVPSDLALNELITYYKCDLTSAESVKDTAASIRDNLGNPSILVNNAGITGSHTILKTPPDFLQRIFSTNVMAHWRTVQEFVPSMVARNRGHIVTVASMSSFITNSANCDYTATKAGLLAFHEGLTSELKIWYKAPGVVTTIVHTSFVRTPLIEASVLESGQGEATLDSMLTPEEVAQSILKQILSRRGAQLIIPSSVAPISWLKALPNWCQEAVREGFGRMSAAYGGSVIAR